MLNLVAASLVPLLISAFCAAFISRVGLRLSFIDMPNERSSHSSPTPRGGGIGIWIAFMFACYFSTRDILLIMITSCAGLIGFLDDRFDLSYKLRLSAQIVISILGVYLFRGAPQSPLLVILFLFLTFFIVGTSNFYNFMDGINGIAGLTGIVGFGLMAFFAGLISHDLDIAFMSTALLLACLGFLPFNFPNAKVFMGDVGSLLLGFVFASFVVKLSSDIRIFLCIIMFMFTFYADALLTIIHRWRRGENLMKAHRSHLYQYLSNELGYAHWKVSLGYACAQLIFGLSALFAYTRGLAWQIAVLVVFSILFHVCYKHIKNLTPRS